jgi:hypothetical protein
MKRRWYWPLALVGLGLVGCTPAQQAQVGAALDTVQAACNEALPLANLAIVIPTVGPFVAAGVQVGCGTAAGLAKLNADPTSAAWLAQQAAILKAALTPS